MIKKHDEIVYNMNNNELQSFMDNYNIIRNINSIHLHHSYKPDFNDCNNVLNKYSSYEKIISGIKRYHKRKKPFGRGWSDIAYHLLITPDGKIWEGRSFNIAPCSTKGFDDDGIPYNKSAFAICMIGNFDRNKDIPTKSQIESLKVVVSALTRKINLDLNTITFRYHTELDRKKTCPGDGFYSKLSLIQFLTDKISFVELLNSNSELYYTAECIMFTKLLQEKLDLINLTALKIDGIYGRKTHREMSKVIEKTGTKTIQKFFNKSKC